MGAIDTEAKAYMSDKTRFATLSTIRNLMETSGWDAKQTMAAMKIPSNEQEKYEKQIKK